MDKIAEMIYQAYMQTGNWRKEKEPEGMEEITKEFLPTLDKKKQYEKFLDLELCYLELSDIRAKSVIEFILRLIYPEEK